MKAEDPKQPRQPWRFTVDGGAPFAFAGLCTRKQWDDAEDRGVDDGYLYSATIITTTPNEVVKPVHNRMPAILPERRGRGGLAASRPQRRGRDRDARRRSTPRRMEGAPANPALNKVGKGMAEGPELLVAPQEPAPTLLAFFAFAFFFGFAFFFAFFGFSVFGFFVDRRRQRASARPSVSTVALPALVVDRAGDLGLRGPWSSARSSRRAVRRSCFGLPAMKYSRCSVPTSYSGHSTLTPCSLVNVFRQVVDFEDGVFGAVGAEVDHHRFRHFLGVDAVFRGARDRASAGRPRSGRFRRPCAALDRADDAAVGDRRAGLDLQHVGGLEEGVAADVGAGGADQPVDQLHLRVPPGTVTAFESGTSPVFTHSRCAASPAPLRRWSRAPRRRRRGGRSTTITSAPRGRRSSSSDADPRASLIAATVLESAAVRRRAILWAIAGRTAPWHKATQLSVPSRADGPRRPRPPDHLHRSRLRARSCCSSTGWPAPPRTGAR